MVNFFQQQGAALSGFAAARSQDRQHIDRLLGLTLGMPAQQPPQMTPAAMAPPVPPELMQPTEPPPPVELPRTNLRPDFSAMDFSKLFPQQDEEDTEEDIEQSAGATVAREAGVPTPPKQLRFAFESAAQNIGMGRTQQLDALRDYIKTGGVNQDPATRAWCADYVNAALGHAGMQGTGSGMARSFLNWGTATDQPQQGDIAVFSRGDPNGPYGHVGFFNGYTDDGKISVLGGNQGGKVSIANYSPNNLLGFRTAGDAPTGAGASVPIPQQQRNTRDTAADYDERIAALEQMATGDTPRYMNDKERFSRDNFSLGGLVEGLGVGFGQMSTRGGPVNLSSVVDRQERQSLNDLEWRTDAKRRSAAAQMAYEMGDENAARAIAQGGIDFNQFLSQRQMEQVEARALRAETRDEIGRQAIFDYLAPTLGEDAARAAMMNPSAVLGFEQMVAANRAAEEARMQAERAFAERQQSIEQLLGQGDPVLAEAAQLMSHDRELSLKDAVSLARGGVQNPTAFETEFEAYQNNPEAYAGMYEAKRSPGVQINMGNGPQGDPRATPSAGLQWKYATDEDGNILYDPNPVNPEQMLPRIATDASGAYLTQPIVGSKEWQDEQERRSQQELSRQASRARTNNINSEVERAIQNINNGALSGMLGTTGLAGYVGAMLPGSAASDLSALITSLEGASALENLQMLKQATGAGLGNVTDRQVAVLATAYGNLAQAQSEDQLRQGLSNFANAFNDIVYGAGRRWRYNEFGERYETGDDTFGLSPMMAESVIDSNDPELLEQVVTDYFDSRGLPPILSEETLDRMSPKLRNRYYAVADELLDRAERGEYGR